MIVTNNTNIFNSIAPVGAVMPSQNGYASDTKKNRDNGAQTDNHKQKPNAFNTTTESNGSARSPYSAITPGGSALRGGTRTNRIDAYVTDPVNPLPMLRRRTEAFEQTM